MDVDDPKHFLHSIGQRFYGYPSNKIKSIGVTGTNGKTTITYLIESIIHAAARRCGVIGTVNHRIGEKIIPSKNTTPGFLDNQRYLAQLADLGVDYCVMEASSHALDQGRLEGIGFSAGIFTNLTQDHLDYHQNMDSYFKAKSLLFKNLSSSAVSIINVDDDYGILLLPMTKSKTITYAIDSSADVRAQNIIYHLSGSRFEIVFPQGMMRIHTRFIGKHNIYNILAAFAWGYAQGLNPEIIRQGIEHLRHVPGRLEPVENDKGFFIFIDYAHTDDGLINVLKALRAVSAERIILVFGCGGDRDRTKRPKMASAACALADYSIVTTDNPRSEDPQAIINEIITGFTKKNYETCVDRKEAIGRALKSAQKNQIILIAGKGHEDYQIFKDRTIAFNEREIVKELLREGIKDYVYNHEIIEATKGRLVQGPAKAHVRSVCIDSRIVKKGELFIAVKGDVFDGHDFIDGVMAKGVRVLIVHKAVEVKDPKVSVIRVKDTIRALGDIARFHRLRFKIPVIAVTGSAGKTTTKEMIAAVLGRKYKVLKNEGTQNNHIGVPLTLLKLKSVHRMVVLECGTNQPGDIVWLADVARPSVAVFTNIGESHLEKLKTTRGVFKEKWTLTSFMGAKDTVIINADDKLLSRQARKKNIFKIMTYGIKAKADCRASGIHIHSGRYLNFHVGQKTIELNSCGVNNVYNALAAVGCGVFFKVPVKDIAQALKSFEFPQGRGQIVRLGKGWMINDTYNANPVSMRSALQTLQTIETKQKRIFVAADMLELGKQSKALHQAMGAALPRQVSMF